MVVERWDAEETTRQRPQPYPLGRGRGEISRKRILDLEGEGYAQKPSWMVDSWMVQTLQDCTC